MRVPRRFIPHALLFGSLSCGIAAFCSLPEATAQGLANHFCVFDGDQSCEPGCATGPSYCETPVQAGDCWGGYYGSYCILVPPASCGRLMNCTGNVPWVPAANCNESVQSCFNLY